MPRKCTVCSHKERGEIESDILDNVTYRNIGTKYGVSYGAARRHHENGHIAESLILAHEAQESVKSQNLFEKIENLEIETKAIKAQAEQAGNIGMMLQCIEKQARLIELYGKLKGMLKDVEVNVGVQVNIADLSGKTIDFIKKHKLYQKFVKYMQGEIDAERT